MSESRGRSSHTRFAASLGEGAFEGAGRGPGYCGRDRGAGVTPRGFGGIRFGILGSLAISARLSPSHSSDERCGRSIEGVDQGESCVLAGSLPSGWSKLLS